MAKSRFKRLWIGALPEYITLWDYYDNLDLSECFIPWRIYSSRTHKLLCCSYGSVFMYVNSFDNFRVVSSYRRDDYIAVYIDDKDVI